MSQLHAVPLRARTLGALAGVSAVGVIAFFWPFVVAPTSIAADHATDAPGSSPSCSRWSWRCYSPRSAAAARTRRVAMLAVLAAVATAVRPLGAGVAGLEPMFVVLLLGGRALGPAFGFALGSLAMFTSALLTAGVGPWLPFQMMAAGWFAMAAGCCRSCAEELKSRCSWPTGQSPPCCTGS